MCGIAGIVTPARADLSHSLQQMTDCLQHRGPDQTGSYAFARSGLGNTRLSIIDLAQGDQPIFSATRQQAVVFNGEIYGYRELRHDLRDYPFQTETDTEVILALYQKFGPRLVVHLPGMFAFALWDNDRELLICGRDRFGEKPLYYAFGEGGEFLFASEIKALLATGLVKPTLSLEAVSHYLKHTYVHPSQTIYANIYVLPPAHVLMFEQGQVRIERYWDFPPVQQGLGLPEAVEEFRFLFAQAVKKQLIADVPVGAFLSGGVDSSTVVAVASQYQSPIKTFSFGFRAGIENETHYSRQVAQLYQTDHTEGDDHNANLADLLWTMQEVYDEPLADSSNIPTYLISQLARKQVKVALTGDGADELLGGYLFWARSILQQEDFQWLPLPPLSGPARLVHWQNRMRQWLGHPSYPTSNDRLTRKYYHWRYYFTPQELAALGLWRETEHLQPYARYADGTLNDVMRFDLEGYMPGSILVKTDRASMAHGLELRSPFLDVDVATFCLSLPETFKVDRSREKILLREAYQHLWPDEIRERHKQGFGGPMPVWLQRPDVEELKQMYLCQRQSKLFQLLSYEAVQPYVQKNNQQTWSLLVLALWLERHEVTF